MDEVVRLLVVILAVLHICNGAFGQASEGSVRLINGPSDAEGKVQIYHDGEWGVVCDDNWDSYDAEVVCRQLGFYGVYTVFILSEFGRGNWTIWIDEVECVGTEQTLVDCPRRAWGDNDCRAHENAGVRCKTTNDSTAEGSVRLADGLYPGDGRVEFYRYGQWGTVCDDGWDINDVAVVCRQLGFPGGVNALKEALFGEGGGPIQLREVQCGGAELRLADCHEDGYPSICAHSEDAGVRCRVDAEPADGSLRLMNGTNSNEGRLEVYHDGEWGTICDNKWGLPESKVACRQMGWKNGEGFSAGAVYGKGSGQVWLDTVDCKGNENSLDDCSNGGWASGKCNHGQDVGVTCSYTEDGDTRLVDGSGDAHGRVEVYREGIWGTVCNKGGWDSDAADVVCRGQGYDLVSKASVNDVPAGTGYILLEIEHCIGWEPNLRSCDHKGWGRHNCTHDDDVAIKCKNKRLLTWYQITGIVLACVAVVCSLCKCCLKLLSDDCCESSPEAATATAQGTEEPAGEPLNPESTETEKLPPSYDEIGGFPKAHENTSV